MKIKKLLYTFAMFLIALFVGAAGFVAGLMIVASLLNFATNETAATIIISVIAVSYIALGYLAVRLIKHLTAKMKILEAKTTDSKLRASN